jgi:hypothetical protein
MSEQSLALFEQNQIRRVWVDDEEKWYFSVVDIIFALTKSERPRKYWSDLKTKLREEGSELSDKIGQLKMAASDGKYYLSDVADTEAILRLVQSIPSPNAEPFKLWLARVGYERIEEVQDPEKAINRALHHYKQLGYSDSWINQRLKSIEIRKDLTDEWSRVGVQKGREFAILTDDITRAWAGLSTKQYKKHKDLKKENLRDNMTNLELVLTMLAEAATTEISQNESPVTFQQSRHVAKRGGSVAGVARKELEQQTSKKVITKDKHISKSAKKQLNH